MLIKTVEIGRMIFRAQDHAIEYDFSCRLLSCLRSLERPVAQGRFKV
jgi:hypothetical protein